MWTTKTYWFLVVSMPLVVSGMLYLSWPAVGFLKTMVENDSDLAAQFSPEQRQEMFDEIQFYVKSLFQGEHLHYYIFDETGQDFDEAIRYKILQTDYELYLNTLSDSEQPSSTEEFQEDYYERNFFGNSQLSILRHHEIQDRDLTIAELEERLDDGEISGYFVIPEDFTESYDGAQFIRPKSTTQANVNKLNELELWIEQIFFEVLRELQLPSNYVHNDELRKELYRPLPVNIEKKSLTQVSSGDTKDEGTRQGDSSPVGLWLKLATIPFLWLFMSVLANISNFVLANTLEEKSSKAAEMLVSRLSPTTIMDGKLLGSGLIGLVGLVVFCVFVGPPLVLVLNTVNTVLNPTDIVNFLHPLKFINWVLCLVIGFLTFGYIQSALGSLCDDDKDFRSVFLPMTLLQLIGIWPSVIFVLMDPGGKVAQVLSFIPLISPYVMVSRTASLPDWPTYLLIMLFMCFSMYLIRKLTSRVYTIGLTSEHAPKSYRRLVKLSREHS
ncbi:MAG: ABC transporter permease [Gammaproteobacteria bacterium]|nr:ABC transporter permease [Gammaproteobacteria bacterium]MDE0402131.1 ABC transporter permease [Gammaproteobacteria bacterium]